MQDRQTVTVLLFEQFELLDALGPLHMFGLLPEYYQLQIITTNGQYVTSTQGINMQPTLSFNDTISAGTLIIPGGAGMRFATHNKDILAWLKKNRATTTYYMFNLNWSSITCKCRLT
ncbi:DJ-1/PfpI family protein [Photobacterium iliopiscarium]|uniref:DJ-1/PfpI family protein n=1 Tax=Photobacterium iliopiscarium TaxID=56192 RepID=UPI000ADC2AD1|nr:DJ-1/PfpI family protein [Photobacterium iliopiscarium]